ncbi:MAG: aldose epimerase family protein [Pseudomonadota bacterium]|nr:aldose epimerase family protein [Pseudomonadota bacterium]
MKRVVLQNGDMRVALLSYGAITQGWWHRGTPLILGYDDPQTYRSDPNFMGAIVGRLANRVSNAAFEMDGIRYHLDANEGPNHLHGGPGGFWSRDWHLEQLSATEARLTYHSPDGEGGYPGAVDVAVTVTLGPDSLTYEMEARPDRPTPLTLAQHNYYSLGTTDGALTLHVPATHALDLTEARLPTGTLTPVAGTPLDLTRPTALGRSGPEIDHFYVLDPASDPAAPIATLTAASGLTLTVHSDQPGAQVYTGQGVAPPFTPFAGICLEPSGYPNAVNRADFPSVIATPDTPSRQTLRLTLTEAAP